MFINKKIKPLWSALIVLIVLVIAGLFFYAQEINNSINRYYFDAQARDKTSNILNEELFEDEEDDESNTPTNKTTKPLPTSFRKPSAVVQPIIEGASIERIGILGCEDCYADIIMKMDGLTDEQVVEVNTYLT